MSLAVWLNTAWMLRCTGEGWAFRRATRQVAQTQAAVLRETLARNRETEFGRRHRFNRIHDPRQYQEQVPLSTYETYAAQVERVAAGEANILTSDRVELLEPTSGTTGGEKLIPYTATLRRQFQRGVAAWIADLFWQRPVLRCGRAYWSISPALGQARHTSGGIPIGFDDDAAYLGRCERLLLDQLLVVPSGVARIPDLEAFRYCTLLCLLRAEDLALISIWNPTFLTALLDPLENWHERLCFDLEHGTCSVPAALPHELARQWAPSSSADSRRSAHLRSILRSSLSWAEKLRQVWPRIALISCWADAAAAQCLGQVRTLFPTVEIQPKGLLATEGCVSFPLIGGPAPVLAVRSHFFEFEEIGRDPGRCRLAHELDRGGRYRVVLTTSGGLYRYQLRDEVEVAGFENRCPLLRFLGKSDRISDLVGEKLAEPFVRAALDRLFAVHKLAPHFALLVPVESRPSRYRLYLQGPELGDNPGFLAVLGKLLQAALEENPHYAYAVSLGQLAPVEIGVLDPGGERAWRVYERQCLARGQKAGNIKPVALDPWTGWAEEFRRRGLEQPSGDSPSGLQPVPAQSP